MTGYIVVVAAPSYVVTDEQGRFKFNRLAPGKYKLKAWSERSKAPIEQDVTIPSRSIVQIERREFDRTRTGLSVAGGVATLLGVFLGFKAGGNDTPEIPQPPVEEEAGSRLISTVFRIPLPFGAR